MTDIFRIGIIGLGGAGEVLLKTFLERDDCVVVALADTNETRLQALAINYDIANTYSAYQALLARDDIDIVATATPNFLHAEIAVAALNAGKHMLTEKPLAHTLADAERMVAAAQAANRVLKMVDNHRHGQDVQTLKRHIDTGELGRLYHAKAYWLRRSGIPGRGGNWFTQRALSGGGPMIDLGVHVLDMALYLLDEPEVATVSAATYAEHGRHGRGFWHSQADGSAHDVEDFCTAFIRMTNGATLTLDISWELYGRHGDDFGVAVFGTTGGGSVDIERYDRTDTLRIYTDIGGRPAIAQPRVSGNPARTAVVDDLLAAIKGGDWAAHHGQSALKRSRILDACYRSAAAGHEIAFD